MEYNDDRPPHLGLGQWDSRYTGIPYIALYLSFSCDIVTVVGQRDYLEIYFNWINLEMYLI